MIDRRHVLQVGFQEVRSDFRKQLERSARCCVDLQLRPPAPVQVTRAGYEQRRINSVVQRMVRYRNEAYEMQKRTTGLLHMKRLKRAS